MLTSGDELGSALTTEFRIFRYFTEFPIFADHYAVQRLFQVIDNYIRLISLRFADSDRPKAIRIARTLYTSS